MRRFWNACSDSGWRHPPPTHVLTFTFTTPDFWAIAAQSSGELDVSRPLPGDETSAAEAEGIGSVAAAVAGLALANGIEVPRHVADFVGAVGVGPDAAVAADDDSSSDDGADLGGAPPVAVKGRVRHFASSSSSGSGSDSG